MCTGVTKKRDIQALTQSGLLKKRNKTTQFFNLAKIMKCGLFLDLQRSTELKNRVLLSVFS